MSGMKLVPNRLFGGTALSAAEASKVNSYIADLEEAVSLYKEIRQIQKDTIKALNRQVEVLQSPLHAADLTVPDL